MDVEAGVEELRAAVGDPLLWPGWRRAGEPPALRDRHKLVRVQQGAGELAPVCKTDELESLVQLVGLR